MRAISVKSVNQSKSYKSTRWLKAESSDPGVFGGFTLVELLTTIAIVGVLAALIIPTISKINAMRAVGKTKTELKEVESWILNYKTTRGYYPPDNPGNAETNQLFYELSGTVFKNGIYQTLDGSASANQAALGAAFANPNLNGFMNAMKEPRDEGMAAQKFIKELKPEQVAELNSKLRILVGSVGWDTSLPPPTSRPGVNPFRYISTNPTHNSNSFDLWIDIYIQGKTLRICNWSEEPIAL